MGEQVKSDVRLCDCDIFLMNSDLMNPIGDFKAKITIMCPNSHVMEEIERWFKVFSMLEGANKNET